MRLEIANGLIRPERHSDAIRHYEASLADAPDAPPTLHNLGALLWRRGDAASAVRYLSRAVELSPSASDAHIELGYAHAANGDVRSARMACMRAIRLDPGNAGARKLLLDVDSVEASTDGSGHDNDEPSGE